MYVDFENHIVYSLRHTSTILQAQTFNIRNRVFMKCMFNAFINMYASNIASFLLYGGGGCVGDNKFNK